MTSSQGYTISLLFISTVNGHVLVDLLYTIRYITFYWTESDAPQLVKPVYTDVRA
jgi:hypothetical protein